MVDNMISNPYIRTLIAKEIELGFLYIDSRARAIFPKESGEIRIKLGNSKQNRSSTYNAKYNRIFGLVSWYRRNNLTARSQIEISVDIDGIFHLQMLDTPIDEPKYTPEEIEEIVDLSGLSSMAT